MLIKKVIKSIILDASNVTRIFFPHNVSHWMPEGKISLLHVRHVGKLESTHKVKVINQNKGKL